MSTLKTAALLALLAASALLGACESNSPTEPENVQAPDVLCETGPYLIHLKRPMPRREQPPHRL